MRVKGITESKRYDYSIRENEVSSRENLLG
jgi:hypothetical protein